MVRVSVNGVKLSSADQHTSSLPRRGRVAAEGGRVGDMANENSELEGNLDGVLTLINDTLHNPHPASLHSATLPLRGRD